MALRLTLVFIALMVVSRPVKGTHIIVKTGDGGNSFSPAHFSINPGDTVTWIWASGHHNTSAYSVPTGAGSWYSNLDHSTPQYTVVPTVSGLYKYTCTHHSGMDGSFFVTGCSFPAKPVINSSNGNSFCAGTATTLSVPYQPGYKYQWLNGTTAIPGDSNLHITTKPGSYRLAVSYCGVDSVSDMFPVTVHAKPVPSFRYNNSDLAYTFTNTTPAINDHNFVWSFSDGTPHLTTHHAYHTFADSGTYIVTLTAIDKTITCTDSTAINIRATLSAKNLHRVSFTVTPNPSSDFIDIVALANCKVWLTDVQGRIIDSLDNAFVSTHSIDVRLLQNGIYFVHIKTALEHKVIKVLVSH